MDTTRTKTIERETNINSFANDTNDSKRTQERLDMILSENDKYARRNELFKDDREKLESELMSNPMSVEKAFSYFGLMLGAIPPATILTKAALEDSNLRGDDIGFMLLFALANVATAFAGYFSGKFIGKISFELEKVSWTKMLFAIPFVGILWGIISGGAGGFLIFIIGAIFGGIIGGMVGSVALPAFTILHRIFKRGDKIDSKHFYPIAFGITFVICAFILGL